MDAIKEAAIYFVSHIWEILIFFSLWAIKDAISEQTKWLKEDNEIENISSPN